MTQQDPRLEALTGWLEDRLGPLAEPPRPASTDASFRRYFRVAADGTTLIAMDAPPEHEDTASFIEVAALLEQAGLHAPRILARDTAAGFLLLEDLGDRTYLDAIADTDPEALYTDAIDALVRWQAASRADVLPVFDEDAIQRELDLFPQWYVRRHLGHEPDPAWQARWTTACRSLIDHMTAQARVFVHRDFTPRNLMLARPRPGIIDFQDAVLGPITYDWVSLVRDAFVSWPADIEQHWLGHYRRQALAAGLPLPPQLPDLQRAVDMTAAQRYLKVIGIFARLWHRDGKAGYVTDIPRFLDYLERETAGWAEMAPLRELLAALPRPPADVS